MPALTDVTVHLRIAGAVLLCIAATHTVMPRLLGWPAELKQVSLLTRQISYVHTWYIGFLCAFFGFAAVALADDLVAGGRLAALFVLGGLVAWGSRLVIQLCVFDPSLWRGRALTVLGHLAFVALWTYQTAVFAWAMTCQV